LPTAEGRVDLDRDERRARGASGAVEITVENRSGRSLPAAYLWLYPNRTVTVNFQPREQENLEGEIFHLARN
jgi:hypothetical protein